MLSLEIPQELLLTFHWPELSHVTASCGKVGKVVFSAEYIVALNKMGLLW